jgi:uncharacterized protein
MDENALKERMLKENAEFKKLFEEHQNHEKKLAEFKGKPYLTDVERLKEKELKKRKLALKDRMYLMMRDFQKSL